MSDPGHRIPFLSVVIPTMGRDILIRTLESLAATEEFEELEVIVAGHVPESTVAGALRDFCLAHANARHLDIQFETGDSSRKKNAGAAAAAAPLIAFLDDDVVVAPDWPRRMREVFTDERVGLASGPSLVPDDINFVAREAGLALSSRAAGYVAERYRRNREASYAIDWDRVIGCNAVYRREAFEDMGGFPADFYPGEEMMAAFRTEARGWKLMFVPAAWVQHYPRQSLGRFWRQVWGYGATRIRLLRGGVSFTPLPLVPGAWVGASILLAVLALFRWEALALLGLELGLYALGVLAITVRTVMRTRRAGDLTLLGLIPLMHLAYGLAEWVEFFRPGRDFSERQTT
ncbi:MAG: glycosyltransferase family 2 protein [Kiritimatiellae bacterium]|nr:glycosyltransferase family 2 protein [Kiritimatiellia bacterium]MDD4117399.1 glycosyltransferase family 2 protein [Kiritimatiellia bacterium]NCC91766.1 glycosyltransferase family 2 protein [Opitutae bacterium]